MKKFLVVLSLMMLMCSAVSAAETEQETFATKGSALVPGMYTAYGSTTYDAMSHIFLSNITGSNVTCKVTVYDQEGNDVTASKSIVLNGGNAGMTVASNSGVFDIPAHGTRLYKFYTSTAPQQIIGHAVVEWTSDDAKLHKALIGSMYRQQKIGGSYSNTDMPINGGQPF